MIPINEITLPLSQVRNTDYGAASLAAAVIAKGSTKLRGA